MSGTHVDSAGLDDQACGQSSASSNFSVILGNVNPRCRVCGAGLELASNLEVAAAKLSLCALCWTSWQLAYDIQRFNQVALAEAEVKPRPPGPPGASGTDASAPRQEERPLASPEAPWHGPDLSGPPDQCMSCGHGYSQHETRFGHRWRCHTPLCLCHAFRRALR